MSHPWHSQQVHLFPSNPYPTPPPPIAHKVWILNCKNCHMFLTNRGMKAVLLLQPNVSLYSSDALPVNCSPYNSNPHAQWPPTAYKSNNLSYMPPRTCECLTQSLCCHGCGNTIGYMIVIPCSRCTSSISATNRVTNGHRFVFQTGEVLGTERHYIPNEKGVIPFVNTGTNTISSLQPDTYPEPQLNAYPYRRDSADSFGQVAHVDPLESPPSLEFANLVLDYSERQLSEDDSWAYPGRRVYYSPSHSRASHVPALVHPHYHPSSFTTSSTDARSQPPLFTNLDSSYTADQKYASITPPILKAGDVIFWHHLARSGEILGVIDDERARRPAGESAGGRMDFDR